jgi:hypothetical protein
VACHFLLSMAVIAAAYQLWVRTGPPTTVEPPAALPLRALTAVILTTAAAVLAAGTVVTGSGPHAGDEHAHRTGLDPAAIAQLHTDLVMLLVGLSVAAWFALRAAGGTSAAVRAAAVLVAVECGQALIGFVQYFTHLPAVLVGAHLLGAALVWVAALRLRTAVVGTPATAGRVDIRVEKTAVNVIDAAAQGAGDGLHLALNIGGMLIAFLALIAMCNGMAEFSTPVSASQTRIVLSKELETTRFPFDENPTDQTVFVWPTKTLTSADQ